MHLVERKKVRDQILACDKCELRKKCKSPVPFSGVTPNRIMILGEAPGKQEDEQGKPFVGPSGLLVRQELARANFDVKSLVFANVVSCYPNGTPTTRQLNACRDNLTAQMQVIRPDFILVLGATAVRAFWQHARITWIRGHWWQYEGINCLATWHPAAVLRDSRLAADFEEDIWSFMLGCAHGAWRDWWCAKCSRYTTIQWTLDGIGEGGVPLCAKCLVGERRKGHPAAVRTEQEQMTWT